MGGTTFPGHRRSNRRSAFLARTRLPPTNATYKTQRTDLGHRQREQHSRTAHTAARRFGLSGPAPARIPEQQRESVRAGIAGREHGDGQFVLDPKTGVLGLTWRIQFFGAWQLSQQPVQRTFCSNGRGTW